MNAFLRGRSEWGRHGAAPERSGTGAFLKDDMRAAAMAVVLVAAGLFWWQVATLEDCRNIMRKSGSSHDLFFSKSECPPVGPYAADSSVILFALLSPLFPSATAEQRPSGLDIAARRQP